MRQQNQLPHDTEAIESGVGTALQMLKDCPDDRFLEILRDPSPIHEALFFYAKDDREMIGRFRTDGMWVRFITEGSVIKSVRLTEPENIPQVMSLWAEGIETLLLTKPRSEIGIGILAQSMYYFFEAHPFFDGNGRTLRALFVEICARCGYSLSDDWTIARRPYDRHFRYALRHYRTNPGLLYGALKGFIDKVDLSSEPDVLARVSRGECSHCDEYKDDLFKFNSCITKCVYYGGDGGDDDGQSFLDYLTSILSQTGN